MQVLHSNKELGRVIPNIGTLLQQNHERFAQLMVYKEKGEDGEYHGITWSDLYSNIENIAFNLSDLGFRKGDKMVLFSRNCLEMLQMELAVMAMGGIAVPIFSNFKKDTAELLIKYSDAEYMTIAGQQQLSNIGDNLGLRHIIVFDDVSDERFPDLIAYTDLLKDKNTEVSLLDNEISGDTICLNMFTSGTMGIPKCVQLTHGNILSQQAAIEQVWQLDQNDRFLAYLPWHHSFGGIFELFSALYSGACYHLESSFGKKPESIMDNWRKVSPTVFFSVPKVYKALVELSKANSEVENMFFNSGLKYIFTAAAALPIQISNEFERRGIPVTEGWGLTETSPCCTLTDPNDKRETGVIGKPIPGVSVRIADDDEIQVKGPNVMVGYYNNDEANANAFTSDGWYRTGDVGALTEHGLKLISRKDRIFKLSNGEKVIPKDMEKLIELNCHYVSYAIVSGSGKDYPVALIFPNKRLLDHPNYEITPEEGCFSPRSLDELGRCLKGCLNDANCAIGQKFSKIQSAAVINSELSLEDKTLTPSMKVAPKNVVEKYKNHLKNLYGENVPLDEEVYVVKLDPNTKKRRNFVQD